MRLMGLDNWIKCNHLRMESLLGGIIIQMRAVDELVGRIGCNPHQMESLIGYNHWSDELDRRNPLVEIDEEKMGGHYSYELECPH